MAGNTVMISSWETETPLEDNTKFGVLAIFGSGRYKNTPDTGHLGSI